MFISKFFRIRLVFAIFILATIWFSFYYFLQPIIKDTYTKDQLVVKKVDKTSVKLEVYYECLCPDSKSFFIYQVLPALKRLPNRIKTDFIPYGKAETEKIGPDHYKFKCQHGELECLGNRVHSCVISRVSDYLRQAKILTCMISDNFDPEESGKRCTTRYGVDWSPVWACASGLEGEKLLKMNGDRTNALYPSVSFIPTVILNANRDHQAALLKNLWEQICREFKKMTVIPDECSVI